MGLTHMHIRELLDASRAHACDGVGPDHVCVKIAAIAEMPSRFGQFHIVAFYNNKDNKEHVAIVRGDVTYAEDVPVRVHSECLTGDVLGSLRCDCGAQLQQSIRRISEAPSGVLVYMREQEGRGIGLANKIRAYALQDEGLDTVEANHRLGFRDDHRRFELAAQILKALGVQKLRLMTNNPRKLECLEACGLTVVERAPILAGHNPHNAAYLSGKRDRLGHALGLDEPDEHVAGPAPRRGYA